jgi:hypothetical protein
MRKMMWLSTGKRGKHAERHASFHRAGVYSKKKQSKCSEGSLDSIIVENKDENKHLESDGPEMECNFITNVLLM